MVEGNESETELDWDLGRRVMRSVGGVVAPNKFTMTILVEPPTGNWWGGSPIKIQDCVCLR